MIDFNWKHWSYLFTEILFDPWRFRLYGRAFKDGYRSIGISSFYYDGVYWHMDLWWGGFLIEEQPGWTEKHEKPKT